jgi:26S proteasome regulatory subunit N9
MRAMSLGLIKGSMDEVKQSFDVTWVQPRVLDKNQLGHLCGQLDSWLDK